jgi:hypothetical protein
MPRLATDRDTSTFLQGVFNSDPACAGDKAAHIPAEQAAVFPASRLAVRQPALAVAAGSANQVVVPVH